MRKIPNDMENPIDDFLISLADKDYYYKKIKMTPNKLTTISLFFSLLSSQQLYEGNNILAVIFFVIAYYFDCVDGNFARKYNMVTEFGDYYDHYSDFFKVILLFFVMIKKDSKKAKIAIPIMCIFLILVGIHIGCQEKMYNNESGQPYISSHKKLCPDKSYIYYTRYFGCGTAMLVTALIILFY